MDTAKVQSLIAEIQALSEDLTFGGDMRDIRVSFAKIRRTLGLEPTLSVEAGIQEVRDALLAGVIKDPWESRHRNAQFIGP